MSGTVWNPPESEGSEKIKDDRIEGSMYSRLWLRGILFRLAKYCECGEGDDIENDLCLIWDTTTTEGVVVEILKFKAHTIFTHLGRISDDPRITEIAIGVLANIACFDMDKQTLAELSDFSIEALTLFTRASKVHTDSRVLLETVRLSVAITIASPEQSDFVDKIPLEAIYFILEQSLKRDLVSRTCSLIRCMFDRNLAPTKRIYDALITAASTQRIPNRHLLCCLLIASVQNVSSGKQSLNKIVCDSLRFLNMSTDIDFDDDTRLETCGDEIGNIVMTHIEIQSDAIDLDEAIPLIIALRPLRQSMMYKILVNAALLNPELTTRLSSKTKEDLMKFMISQLKENLMS